MLVKSVSAVEVEPLESGDVAGAVAALRSASLRELRSESFLAEQFLLMLGLNNEMPMQFPEDLYRWCGKGIRSWQYPIQFAKYLSYLSEKKIKSYVEIGVRHGGTFIVVLEYLRRFSDVYTAYGFDIERADIMDAYARQTVGVTYLIASSTAPEWRSYLSSYAWDLAFIDGDHSYEGCWSDFQSLRQKAKRIALHDIVSSACPGVVQAWSQITSVVPGARLFEAVDQYRQVLTRQNAAYLGIGVVDFSDD
jgi:hypothetical protein